MLEVVILALVLNGCQSLSVEGYNPDWLKKFDREYPSNPNNLFPEIESHQKNLFITVSARTKNFNGLEFQPIVNDHHGFHFITTRRAEMILTSILFEFFNNGKCQLTLTFATIPHTLNWIVTSPVYNTEQTQDAHHVRNYAVSPSQYLSLGSLSELNRNHKFTSFRTEWIERVILHRRRRARCYGGTPTEMHCAGVAVVLPDNILNLMQEKMGVLV